MSKLNQGVIEWYAMYNDVVKTGEIAGAGLGANDNRAGAGGPAEWNDPLLANRYLWENKVRCHLSIEPISARPHSVRRLPLLSLECRPAHARTFCKRLSDIHCLAGGPNLCVQYIGEDAAGRNPIAWNEFMKGGLDMKTRDELLRQKEHSSSKSPPPSQSVYESPPRSRDKFQKTALLTKELMAQYATGNRKM